MEALASIPSEAIDLRGAETPGKTGGRERNLLLTILLVGIVAVGASWLAVREGEGRLLRSEATEAAERWASVFKDRLTGLEATLGEGQLSAADLRLIEFAARAGHLFRYRFFSSEGALVLSSEEVGAAGGHVEPSLPAAVLRGETVVRLAGDAEFVARGMVAGEAYVPVVHDGRFLGAIGVHVDMTARAAVLRRAGEYVLLGVIALVAALGAACGFLVARNNAARDREMTDLMESQRRALAAERMAERANRSKSEFLATVSHELRTPLNAIIGFSEVIAGEGFGPLNNRHYAEFARDIHNSGTHLLEVINDILDLSKIEAGKLELAEDDFDPAMVIESSIRLVRPRAEDKNVALSVRLPDKLPRLHADERKVRQILINLLSNAVKFTPEGGVVTVAAEAVPENGLTIAVSDTGIGIAAEDIPTVLAPFGQADSSRSRNFEGTGLGLPLAKSLAELHGGRFELVSEAGAGTTVTVHFPPRRLAG